MWRMPKHDTFFPKWYHYPEMPSVVEKDVRFCATNIVLDRTVWSKSRVNKEKLGCLQI